VYHSDCTLLQNACVAPCIGSHLGFLDFDGFDTEWHHAQTFSLLEGVKYNCTVLGDPCRRFKIVIQNDPQAKQRFKDSL
jgi:hypothetical protein